MLLFATLQGLASLANGAMLDDADLDATVADVMRGLMLGLRPR
jgi:hypothetical protein